LEVQVDLVIDDDWAVRIVDVSTARPNMETRKVVVVTQQAH
jgi:hypothetical protein